MKTIRKGIFETNSSSTHALVISNNDVMNIESPLVFRFGEFGWEFEEYSCPEDRASYLSYITITIMIKRVIKKFMNGEIN